MRVCMILEGCYPYTRGGVSAWADALIRAMPEVRFVLWIIRADRDTQSEPLYELPDNVDETREIVLSDALDASRECGIKSAVPLRAASALRHLALGEKPDWDVLFDVFQHKLDEMDLLCSREFFEIAGELSQNSDSPLPLSDAFYSLRSMLLPLCYILRSRGPEADVYHAVSAGYAGVLGAMAGSVTGRPFVMTEHGIYPRECEEELIRAAWVKPAFRDVWTKFFYSMSVCAYERARIVTSLFEGAKAMQIAIGCESGKCRVIPNGIRAELFSHAPPCECATGVNIGAFIRFAPIKDIRTLIYAFYNLRKTMPDARLFLCGGTDDEEYKAECLGLIERLGLSDAVNIEGYVEISSFLPRMDITALSSISEGQPLAVLESLAAARPCVTTRVGCCAELLENQKDGFGLAGITVKPMDARGLSLAMEKLLKDGALRREMGLNGRRRVLAKYGLTQSVARYEALYREAAENGGRGIRA